MAEWNPHANELFLEALDRPAGPLRTAFLDQTCIHDERLRRDVVALLEASERASEFFSSPAQEFHQTFADPALQNGPGSVVGPYKLLEEIGEGGMGVVYMAEQTQPVRRTVALKILKPGMDSRQVVARFEAERQALALMDHPNIAKVLDAGTVGDPHQPPAQAWVSPSPPLPLSTSTTTGRPYFVMELVKGLPITKYCDLALLTVKERLNLFLPVCQAIQHAHQKGVIHRDIKPTNILVALYDGVPVPKVIDFGVAKAIGPKLTEKTLFTGFGQLVGTLEYMSPEQAQLNQFDIDTRSDIYSLGVLLYELLTGMIPIDQAHLHKVTFDETLRIIREVEPLRPSTKISSSDTLATIAANRRSEPAQLGRQVKGDLDWVVMKALEKDRNRRYATANALANDIEHYLANEPVEACPPSAAYRLRLLMRRHKPAVITAGIVAASLIVATVISISQAAVARRAEALAEQRLAAEQKARRQSIAALVYLLGDKANSKEWDQIVAQITGISPSLPSEVSEVARVLCSLARQENSRRNWGVAERLASRSADLNRTVAGDHHLDTAESLHGLGFALWNQRKLDEADAAYQEAVRIYRKHYGDDAWPVLFASRGLLSVAQARGDERTTDEIRARAEQALKHANSDVHALRYATSIFVALEQWKQAEECIVRSIELYPTSVHPPHSVALLQLMQKNHEGYRVTCQAALVQGEQLGDFNSHFLVAWTCLLAPESGVERDQIDALLKSAQDGSATDHLYKQAAAIALYRAGRYEEAENRFLELIAANPGADTQQLHATIARFFLAMTQQQQNRPHEARSSLELARHEAEIVRQNHRISWEDKLAVRLWCEEAEQLVPTGEFDQGA